MKTIYVTACDKNGGIYRYHLSDDGKLTLCDITPCDSPMYLCINGDCMDVVLREPIAESENSAILSYKINTDGSLCAPTSLISTMGKVGCHLCRFDGALCCTNYVSGSVLIGSHLITHQGSGPNLPRQDQAHTHFCAVSPDGRYLLVCDLGLDTVFVYKKDGTPVSSAKVPDGHGARHLAFSQDGHFVYCVNELASTVTVFAYRDGVLSPLDTYDALPADFNGTNTAAAIKLRGNHLYVSHRGHDSVAHFEIVDGGAKLIRHEIVSVGGKAPRDIELAGDFLIATNQDSNTVTVLKMDGDTVGAVCDTQDAPCPICAVCVE